MARVVEYLLFLLLTVVPARQCLPQNGNYVGFGLNFTVVSESIHFVFKVVCATERVRFVILLCGRYQ